MTHAFYDSLSYNEDIELDLSMLEATGMITHDESRNHIMATIHATVGTPVWQALASGNYGLSLNPAYPISDMRQYLDAPAAATGALDFTNGDYSLAMWFNWIDTSYSQILMGKYAVDIRGWEAYITRVVLGDLMTVRHHHGGTRSGTYSAGWNQSQWQLFGYSRTGATAQHYRNGQPITTIGALQDPASSAASDLIIGRRFTGNQNWFKARFHRPRAWSRAVTASEHRILWELERGWFGL